MSVQVQLRRDTDANILLNKGAVGEVLVDTTVFRWGDKDMMQPLVVIASFAITRGFAQ